MIRHYLSYIFEINEIRNWSSFKFSKISINILYLSRHWSAISFEFLEVDYKSHHSTLYLQISFCTKAHSEWYVIWTLSLSVYKILTTKHKQFCCWKRTLQRSRTQTPNIFPFSIINLPFVICQQLCFSTYLSQVTKAIFLI